mmetsp:Transcript_47090/g.73682  ORF Transcript_47090/g.73682 Transcript_47090/m.73682 type:complete len:135 (-) Transcript_47090:193-597(-)
MERIISALRAPGSALSSLSPQAGAGLLRPQAPGIQRNMVRLRLQRFGRTHLPFYRLVAADARSPRDGRCIEYLGTYNPKPNNHNEKIVTLNVDRIKYWLVVGAQPTDTVAKLLGSANILPAKPSFKWGEPRSKE